MDAERCKARGTNWSCSKGRKYRLYCTAHQRQLKRGQSLRPLKIWTPIAERLRDGEYLCKTCLEYKSIDRFGAGRSGPRPDCHPCTSAKVRAKRYGLEPEDIGRMLAAQNGRCLICAVSQDDSSQVFAVDHDHACCPDSNKTCGKCVRGLLCRSCNSGLGHFRDTPEFLRNAAAYLEEKSHPLRSPS